MNLGPDNTIKLEYDPVQSYERTGENIVGASALRKLDFTPTNANSIFVSKAAAEPSPDGTKEHPYMTIASAIPVCDAARQNIVIIDSATYTEGSFIFSGKFKNLYAGEGFTPVLNLEFDNSNIFTSLPATLGETLTNNVLRLNNVTARGGGGFVLVTCADFSDYDEEEYLLYYDSAGNYLRSVAGGTYQNNWRWKTNYIYPIGNSGAFLREFYYGSYQRRLAIYDQNGNIAHELIGVAGISDLNHITELPDGRIILLYRNGSTMNYIVYNSSLTLVDSGTIDDSYGYKLKVLKNGDICCVSTYGVSPARIIRILDFTNGYAERARVIVEVDLDENTAYSACYQMKDGNIIMVTSCRYVVGGYVHIIDQNCNLLYHHKYTDMATKYVENGDFVPHPAGGLLYFRNDGANAQLKVDYYDYTGNKIVSDNPIQDSYSLTYIQSMSRAVIVLQDTGDFVYIYYPNKFQIKPLSFMNGVTIPDDSEINGITVDAPSTINVSKLFSFDGSIGTVKNCTFRNITMPEGSENCLVKAKNRLIFRDNLVHDNSHSIIAEGEVTITQNVFYRNSCNAIETRFAGAIDIQHNTFFDNTTDIQLLNNDGNEVIKNNIHHESITVIDAETSVIYDYSIDTVGNTTNASPGNNVSTSNPLFINEGAADPEDIDMLLRLKVNGYEYDSPAYLSGDDGENMGGYIFRIEAVLTNWKTAYVDKPLAMQRWIESAGAITSRKEDGSIETRRKGKTEFLNLPWEGILNEHFDLVYAIWNSSSNLVRVTPNPETSPDVNFFYKVIYDKLMASAEVYPLDDTGKQGVNLLLARKVD